MPIDRCRIGIIGGQGQMGNLFRKLFESLNFDVLISDKGTDLSPITVAEQADVVILAVPIENTEKIIRDIGPFLSKDKLIMDLTSIKVAPVKAMLEFTSCEVIGAHPLFGPAIDSLMDQTIVLCPARGDRWLSWIEKVFHRGQLNTKHSTPEEHDKMMAIIQGTIHFQAIALNHHLKNCGVEPSVLMDYSTPNFRKMMEISTKIMGQDGSLYADILMKNPECSKTLELYLKSCNQLYQTIIDNNKEAFISYFCRKK